MKILLLNPKIKSWSPNPYVPLGLTYIAAVVEQAGYGVEVCDLNIQRLSKENLRQKVNGADIIGITGMITEYDEIITLVNTVRHANNRAKIILGGPLATSLPEKLLNESPSDFVVLGEGEKTIIHLLSAIKLGESVAGIKGIAYRDGGRIIIGEPAESIPDLDTVPFPARHLLDMKRYLGNYFESFGIKLNGFGKIKSTNLISSRGCPYSCTFCFKEMWGNKWRARSPENILTEMKLLNTEYGVNGFFFTDDTFVLDNKRVFRLCQLLKESGLNVAWYCNARINLMTKEMLQAMYEAGCRGIAYGLESGNQQILDSMKKNITLEQTRQVVKWTKDSGINATGYFMIGMLGESKATIRETLAFARQLDLDFYGFSLTTPMAKTQLYDSAMKAGLISNNRSLPGEWSLHVNANLTTDCTDADLAAFENEAFKEFYLRKRFGGYYFLNPGFLKQEARVFLSIRNKEQAKELVGKVKSLVSSYFRKSAR